MSPDSVAYLDTSAAMKLVVPEPDSEALRQHLDARHTHISSQLLLVELGTATSRLGHDSPSRQAVAALLRRCDFVPIGDQVIERASRPFRPTQRALDAIHLATALALEIPELEFCSYDEQQLKAARNAGLTCVSPGRRRRR
ncbi:MAG: type II toxin-antitoxin system VapC family toxin [Baekduia sp.]